MIMYLHVPGIKGKVCKSGYEGWIELSDIDHSKVASSIKLNTPDSSGDIELKPFFGQIAVLKSPDKVSKKLTKAIQSSRIFPQIEIHSINEGQPLMAVSKLILSNALIFFFSSKKTKVGAEKFCIAYTRLERKIIQQQNRQEQCGPSRPIIILKPACKQKQCAPLKILRIASG